MTGGYENGTWLELAQERSGILELMALDFLVLLAV